MVVRLDFERKGGTLDLVIGYVEAQSGMSCSADGPVMDNVPRCQRFPTSASFGGVHFASIERFGEYYAAAAFGLCEVLRCKSNNFLTKHDLGFLCEKHSGV